MKGIYWLILERVKGQRSSGEFSRNKSAGRCRFSFTPPAYTARHLAKPELTLSHLSRQHHVLPPKHSPENAAIQSTAPASPPAGGTPSRYWCHSKVTPALGTGEITPHTGTPAVPVAQSRSWLCREQAVPSDAPATLAERRMRDS